MALRRAPVRTIAIVGLRGCGKSNLGRAMAKELGLPYFDQDKVVERLAGITPREIVRMNDWEDFRTRELAAFEWVCDTTRAFIFATGSGFPIYNGRKGLSRLSEVIYLRASAEYLWQQFMAASDRPDLTSMGGGREDIARIFNERLSFISFILR